MVSLHELIQGFSQITDPMVLFSIVLGSVVGTIAGLLPGLGSIGAMTLLLPYVFTMDPLPAMVILSAIILGANFGNSISAILLNIPGDPAAAPAAIDGHKLALAGRPGPALTVSALASFLGSIVGVIGLALLSTLFAQIAIGFGPEAFFSLTLLGLTMVSALSLGSTIKGYIATAFGLLLTLPGVDPVSGVVRFTLGIQALIGGLALVPVAMGLFAVGEILYSFRERKTTPIIHKVGRLFPSRAEMKYALPAGIRGTILGFFVGVLPGAGSAPAAFASYGLEARVGRRRHLLGTGVIEGVAAPEGANSAAVAGSYVPMLLLGIPGSAPSALVLGALIVLGARPGPLFMAQQSQLFWGLMSAMLMASVVLVILNIPLVKVFASVLLLPRPLLSTIILVLTVVGVYAVSNSMFDVWVAIGIGVISYVMRVADYPLAPVILGFVLGTLLEQSFRQTLLLSQGSFLVFFTEPLSGVILGIIFIIIVGPFVMRLWSGTRSSLGGKKSA